MAALFWDNPQFVHYEALLRQLHTMMAAGEGDSEEADRVRDEMDKPWRHLSHQEVARLKGLSADLYMLEGDEVANRADPSQRSLESLFADLNAALRLENWDEVLGLLRLCSPFTPSDRIAFLRHCAYRALGHLDVAILFIEYAARLEPDDASYEWALVEMLLEGKQFQTAVTRLESRFERSELPPALAIQAASVLVEAAKKGSGEHRQATYSRLVEVLQRALHKVPHELSEVLVLGYLLLGYSHQQLEQWQDALRVYDQALEVLPDESGLLTARGVLRAKTDRSAALPDLRRAVERGTRMAAPYIFVAHDALLRQDYARCLELCAQILSRTDNRRLLAAALQWAAIAQYELNAPSEIVRQNFHTALNFDPMDGQIRLNLERFEELLRSGTRTRADRMDWPSIERFDPNLATLETPSHWFAPLAA